MKHLNEGLIVAAIIGVWLIVMIAIERIKRRTGAKDAEFVAKYFAPGIKPLVESDMLAAGFDDPANHFCARPSCRHQRKEHGMPAAVRNIWAEGPPDHPPTWYRGESPACRALYSLGERGDQLRCLCGGFIESWPLPPPQRATPWPKR